MKKRKLIIPIFAGLIVGQIFAEGSRPFSLSNTIRLGYTDNVYRQADGESSAYVEDILDLAFNASFSDRTDLVVKSQLRLRSDKELTVYPNLYAVLSHSVSPRLMFRFSEYLKSGDRTDGRQVEDDKNDYYMNNLGVVSTYVLTEKDRLEFSLDHQMSRYSEEMEIDDATTIGAGISWAREIRPHRTSAALSLRQSWTEYENRDSSYEQTDLWTGLNHTFNQQWQGRINGGVSYIAPDFGSSAETDSTLNPLFNAGLTYLPSPRTRLTGDFSHKYTMSTYSQYGGQTDSSFILGVQHDVTAKILAKATARFTQTEYDADDKEVGTGEDTTDEYFDLNFRLTYKLNRLNFLELGLRHRDRAYDDGVNDYTENMFDVGWRVEL